VGVTHGYTSVLSRWLQEQGIDAYALQTQYAGEGDDADEVPEGSAEG
jgi:putative mRNA 3-end processing factor